MLSDTGVQQFIASLHTLLLVRLSGPLFPDDSLDLGKTHINSPSMADLSQSVILSLLASRESELTLT